MKLQITISYFLILSFFPLVSLGQTIINVPGDQPTIQAGIDSASVGDTVLVADGTYYENINFKGKAITVASHFIIDSDTNHVHNTIIDGSQSSNVDTASVVFFVSGEDTNSVLFGFTISGGTGTLIIEPGVEKIRGGGGIVLENSGATIMFNRITDNNLLMDLPGPEMRLAAGAAIAAITTDPHTLIIKNNFIYNNNSVSNVSDAFGGGIIVTEDVVGAYSVFISDNEIFDNNATTTITDFQAAGGGILGIIGNIEILDNNVMYNTLSSPTVSIGAGIVLSETLSGGNSLIKNNYVTNNSITNGLGIGGGIVLVLAPSVTIDGNKVEGNASALGGGLFISQSNALVQSNIIKNNSSEFGGGMFVELSTPLINKNLIAGNTAALGGGGIEIEVSPLRGMQSQINFEDRKGAFTSNIFSESLNSTLSVTRTQLRNGNYKGGLVQDESAGALEIRNNTIVNNTANGSLGGAGIASLISTVNVMNSIVGGNQPVATQIQGPVFITYSDIEGGYVGMGNIDADPIFIDTVYFYLDSTLSPCIDAGNPDSIYNDPEDPMNPGYALWPAEGTLRNDMGAYGGNVETGDQQELLGPLFNAFVERVNAAPQQDKQAIVDSFLNTVPSFPFVEENTIAYYIYTGTVGSVNVPGDANGWNSNAFPMTQLDGTLFWYRQTVYESEARLDYKFVLNESNWILDPRNPNTVSGGFGPNSELAMPAYMHPPEIEFNAGIPHGNVHTFLFTSDILNNSRNIRVYTPPGYDSHPAYHYPVVLLHDGLEYISLGSAINILDNLLAESKMNPVIAVFVPPVNRNEEYAFSQTQQFESFIVDELMPHIDTTYRTYITPDKRAMVGLSFGGLITTQICYNNPDQFGLAAPYSPAYWPNNMAVMNMVLNGLTENIKWYIDWGTYEIDIMINGRTMRDGLFNNGYELIWREWFDGHSWGSWRAHLDDALMYFFPKTVDVTDEETVPTEYALSQNYPNPFNPSTTIKYSIPESGLVTIKLYDIIGNEVATLVNEEKSIGRYELHLNAVNLASGVYFYQIRAGSFLETKKMLLLK